jgi:hypothetical protein
MARGDLPRRLEVARVRLQARSQIAAASRRAPSSCAVDTAHRDRLSRRAGTKNSAM